MNDDGTMARLPDLIKFGQKHGIKIGTISDLIAYRRKHDNLVKERSVKAVTSVPSPGRPAHLSAIACGSS